MTEAEWYASDDPRAMLRLWTGEADFNEGQPPGWVKASDRKLRLFACACVRRRGLQPPVTSGSAEAAERFADGGELTPWQREQYGNWTCTPDGLASMLQFIVGHKGADKVAQAALLRDIAGNPFRPVVLPASDIVREEKCTECDGAGWHNELGPNTFPTTCWRCEGSGINVTPPSRSMPLVHPASPVPRPGRLSECRWARLRKML